jgi:hypothetical protein
MKEHQHRDQVRMIGLQAELEATNRKSDIAITDIRKCKTAIHTVETKLASLPTAEETNSRFDRIESMLSATFNASKPRITSNNTITGKRKEQVLSIDNGHEKENGEEEISFMDSQGIMEIEDQEHNNDAISDQSESSDNQTNSQENNDGLKMQLK